MPVPPMMALRAVRVVRTGSVASLACLGMLGLALLVQDAGAAAGSAAVGAIGGIAVGVVVRWSQDRHVGLRHVLVFAAAGTGMFAALHATTALAGWTTPAAVVLAAAWWGLSLGEVRLAAAAGGELAARAGRAVRSLPTLDVRELCRLWDDLEATPVPAQARARTDPRLVGARERLLDELELRDPAGFARWLADGATRSPGEYLR